MERSEDKRRIFVQCSAAILRPSSFQRLRDDAENFLQHDGIPVHWHPSIPLGVTLSLLKGQGLERQSSQLLQFLVYGHRAWVF